MEFYRLLGFNESFQKVRHYDTVVLMDGYGIQLGAFIDPNHPFQDQEPIGLRHIALKVNELEEEIERLKKEEIEVGPILKEWTGDRFCFIKDYDGVLVELQE